jgi:hypothetical protein
MWAWFVPGCWQKGGLLSFRPWLVRRLGMTEEMASQYQLLALLRNSRQLMMANVSLCALTFIVLVTLPILLPILELYWAAVARCAWHDIFEGGTGLEVRKAVEKTAPSLLPA